MSRFDIVFFDAGHTLLHPDPPFEYGIRDHLEAAGCVRDLKDIRSEAYRSLRVSLDAVEAGARSCTNDEEDMEFWVATYDRMLGALGFPGDGRKLGREIYLHFQTNHAFSLYDDVPETLERLQAAGMRMGIISNFSSRLDPILGHLGVRDAFDPCIISAREGTQKPEAEMFRIAVERAGVRPDRAIIVGDNPIDDIRGGGAEGLVPVLIDREDRFPGWADCHRITRLTDLADFALNSHAG